jgi:hypothetical protein
MSPTPVDAMDDGLRRLEHKELSNRPSIGCNHEEQHQHIPQTEAVERSRNARGRMNRNRETEGRNGGEGPATERGEIPDEKKRARQEQKSPEQ